MSRGFYRNVEPTARGPTLEDVAGKVMAFEKPRLGPRKVIHLVSPIGSRFDAKHLYVIAVALESDRLPWCSHADLDLGAHGYPFHKLSEDFSEKSVSFVAPIVADPFTQKTARYAQP